MVKTGLVALIVLTSCWAQQTQNVVFENELVRVTEIVSAPGTFEPRHTHARGLTVSLSEYDNETKSYPEGAVTRRHTSFGEVRWQEPVTHEARNTGSTEQRVIRVELKAGVPSGAAQPSARDPLDSLVVCKDTQKLILENQYARIIEERVPPGVAQPKHRHNKGILIPLASTEVESVDDPDGKPVRRPLVLAGAGWRDPVIHQVRNVGTTELHNIRIELK